MGRQPFLWVIQKYLLSASSTSIIFYVFMSDTCFMHPKRFPDILALLTYDEALL